MNEAMLQLATGCEMVAAALRAMAEEKKSVPETEEKADSKTADVPPKENGAKKLTIEEVRAVLADKSRNGKTQEVRAILKELGADKLSAIPEEKLPDVLKKAEAL